MVAAGRARATRAHLIDHRFAEPLVRAVGVDFLARWATANGSNDLRQDGTRCARRASTSQPSASTPAGSRQDRVLDNITAPRHRLAKADLAKIATMDAIDDVTKR